MTGHDQLFKDLFAAFLGDLLRLVAPELADEMELERFELLPQEAFTDQPDGDRREGEAALLRRQLERRFGPLGVPQRSLLAKADADRLLEWGERVLTARSVEEVFDGASPGPE